MMSGYDSLNKKRFNSRRKVDSELAATTSVGSVFEMRGAVTTASAVTEEEATVTVSSICNVYVILRFRCA